MVKRVRKRMAAIARSVTASVSATEFEVGDIVGVSGHTVGNQIFDNAGTGVVSRVDYKSNRVLVDVHQDEKSDSHPTQFRPEELFLMWRGEDTASDIPLFAVPDTEELRGRAHNNQPRDEKWDEYGMRPI